jgi:hypothetical protein
MQILRGLSSKILPCGCLTGVYETYNGEVVGILDAKSSACTVAAHQTGKQLPVSATRPAADPRPSANASPDSAPDE